MATKVGQKGQIVIPKEIRDKLGVKPGWKAIATLVDNHVEIYFIPPEHNRSLKGVLAKYVNEANSIPVDADWREIEEEAWTRAIEEEADRWEAER